MKSLLKRDLLRQISKGVGILFSIACLAGCKPFKCCEHDHEHHDHKKQGASEKEQKQKDTKTAATYYGPTQLAGVNLTSVVIYGPAQLSDLKAESMVVTGPLRFAQVVLKSAKIMGPMRGEHATCEQLEVTGPLSFKSLRVTGNASVIGPVRDSDDGQFGKLKLVGTLNAHHIFCDELVVTGRVEVAQLYVKKQTTIIGALKAVESEFKDLTITADDIVLEDTKVDMIIVKKDHDKNKVQVLTLKGHTLVRGNIVFESGIGKVIMNRDSQIKGVVKGATVETE